MYGLLDISTSGMIAQRDRLTAISANLANRAPISPDGQPCRGRRVHFSPGDPTARPRERRRWRVRTAAGQIARAPCNLRRVPGNPLGFKSGPNKDYVPESNVSPVVEHVNALQASRAYEANAVAAEATKSMMAQALRLLA